MEIWKEVYKGIIPEDVYKTWITNSEEGGLDIELRGNTYHVIIKFGHASAIRILDEGIVQEGVYSDEEISKYKNDNFMNYIYELKDGEFGKELEKISAGFLDTEDIRHYVIITDNYNIDIITEWEPDLKVSNIQ
ncbi:MAG: hypothetical protein HFH68_13435 [Lachnospiraceae bacterium]|nr:hypothetical protein [Lachnospiraceae bacterium]